MLICWCIPVVGCTLLCWVVFRLTGLEWLKVTLELLPSEMSAVIGGLTSALENYRAQRLEDMKPKKAEQRELIEAECYVSSTERYQTPEK